MSKSEKKYLVEKRNILNEIRSNNMSLPELRFFSIYLAKINARNTSTRIVKFKLEYFKRIMELGKLNMAHLRESIHSLLSKIVDVPRDDGGFTSFQLFKEAVFYKDNSGEWYVEIDAHDKALPLMFEFKEKYFTYELWIALRLKSVNQFRLYEILKQYEPLGERVIDIAVLRNYLGIKQNEYPRFDNFRTRVLDACQEALEKNTDIKFTYEPMRKPGCGRKIAAVKFKIEHSDNYIDQISLSDYLSRQELAAAMLLEDVNMSEEHEEETTYEEDGNFFKHQAYPLLREACKNEFDMSEIQVIYDYLIKIVHNSGGVHGWLTEAYDYLKRRYDELLWRAGRNEIKNRFSYLKKIIEADFMVGEDE